MNNACRSETYWHVWFALWGHVAWEYLKENGLLAKLVSSFPSPGFILELLRRKLIPMDVVNPAFIEAAVKALGSKSSHTYSYSFFDLIIPALRKRENFDYILETHALHAWLRSPELINVIPEILLKDKDVTEKIYACTNGFKGGW